MATEHRLRRPATRFVLGALLLLLASCTGTVAPAPSDSNTSPAGLTALTADPIEPVTRPELGEAVVGSPYVPKVYRATSAADGNSNRMRHEYSRRQAFNADQSRYLVQDSSGYWYLYNTQSYELIGKLDALIGDCEPMWHPSDPNRLYYTGRNGSLQWQLLDVVSGDSELVFDFAGATPWPEATALWTKGEGTTSADGRYLALMATSYDDASQNNKIHGLVTLDLNDRRIVGHLDAAQFPVPHAMPDHISTSPSGEFAVVSWLAGQGGTQAYPLDFSTGRQLVDGSEHSDLAVGATGEDVLVYADYGAGELVAVDVATGERTALHPLYPAEGESYALHISGQAFDRPGWVVVSTYADSADYGATAPAPTLRPEYRKVWLLELKESGRRLNVAHTHADPSATSEDPYFLEPQASASRDLTRIIFASNFGQSEIESYIALVPEDALD